MPTLPDLLTAARRITERDGARPYVGTSDGRSHKCVALDLDTDAHRPDLPTGIASTQAGAVDAFLRALNARQVAAELDTPDGLRVAVLRSLADAFPAGVTFAPEELDEDLRAAGGAR